RRQHDVEIAFEEAARCRLVERAQTEKMSMADLTAHLFRDFHFGLNLVRKNSGQNKFTLPLSAVDAPDKFLSDLVVQSYYPALQTYEVGLIALIYLRALSQSRSRRLLAFHR